MRETLVRGEVIVVVYSHDIDILGLRWGVRRWCNVCSYPGRFNLVWTLSADLPSPRKIFRQNLPTGYLSISVFTWELGIAKREE
jgi:hypothetical protein